MDLSLVDICLKLVVNNFKRYNSLFSTTEDIYIKRLLDFLQRRYSFEILTRLCLKNDLPEEFVDVLVNKHLKFLDTSWFKKCSWEKVTAKVAEIGCHLEKICIQVPNDRACEKYSRYPWQDIICYLSNLKSFTLRHQCNDLILKSIAEFCHDIEDIDIEDSPITSDSIRNLCKTKDGRVLCTKLKKIRLGSACITDNDVAYLIKNLPSLEVIDYPCLPSVLYSLHIKDVLSKNKVKSYNITTLELTNFVMNPFFDNIVKACFLVCPHLKSFACGLDKEERLDSLLNLPELEQLYFKSLCETKIDITSLLKNGGKLNSLTIMNCTVSVSVLIKSCPLLKELYLDRVDVYCDEDEDCKLVHNVLSSLKFTDFPASTNVRAIDLLLSSTTKLELLSFTSCHFTSSSEIETSILKLCELNPINKIIFIRCVIEKEFVKELVQNCHSLRFLKIHKCSKKFDIIYNVDEELLRFAAELLKLAELLPNKPKINISSSKKESIYDYY